MATTNTAIQAQPGTLVPGLQAANRLPPVPWRDPHSVPPEQLKQFIVELQEACLKNPNNADLHTCLGMAHAMNYDVYRSMDALESARRIGPANFMAQFKYAELYYRLRALNKAEAETHRALELAGTNWELALTRRQLTDIRRLRREGLQKPEWNKSLKFPVIGFVVFVMAISWLFMAYR